MITTKQKVKREKPQTFSKYVYQVRWGGALKATFIFEQDAIDYVKQNGGEIHAIGAVR